MTPAFLLTVGLFIALPITAFLLLNVIWSREQVKKDLRQRGAGPIQVRWCPYPFGYWAVFHPACIAFRATFIDASGCIQTGRCVVHTWFHSVYWLSDDLRYLDHRLAPIWRLASFCLALFFGWFGVSHLLSQTLVLPHSRPASTWHGTPVMLLSLAALCCAANLLVQAFFHRAADATERRWILCARLLAVAGWMLFFSAFALAAYQVATA